MIVIDRAIAIIRPKQPMLDWINAYPDAHEPISLEEITDDCTTVLIPDYEDIEDAQRFIRLHYPEIFETELDQWYTDQAYWPAERDIRLFHAWFEVEFHSMIIDLVGEKIHKEEI